MIDQTNQSLGTMSTADALRLAHERGLDLVEVAPHAQPPTCRLVDYGAFVYRQEKTERKHRAKQKKVDVKGIRLTFTIGAHDREMLLQRARKFIGHGHKVKVEMLLKGRQRAFHNRGQEMLNGFAESLSDVAQKESDLGRQGHKYFLVLTHK